MEPEGAAFWERVEARTRQALACGALRPIDTRTEMLEQAGARFAVRVVSSLARKPRAEAAAPAHADPFLHPDRDLLVGGIGAGHLALLNKYNVMAHHLLVVTRDFQPQEAPPGAADLAALWACMRGAETLGFYNSAPLAGASQPHRHLQVVPLPLAPEGPGVPLAPLIEAARPARGGVERAPRLPFRHALRRLDAARVDARPGASLQRCLARLARAAGVRAEGPAHAARMVPPCNLLLTRRWMLLVPRSRECFASVSVNALGFAGALLVRDAGELARLRAAGPMTVLRSVALPQTPG